jgi:hypothetical protein
MGGRGASSGTSVYGNKYGSQYHSLLTVGNIKFLEKNKGATESLQETMTRGRVYVEVVNGKLKALHYFDNENKRSKQIHLDRDHYGKLPHTHHGYNHKEKEISKDGASKLTDKEKKMVERVRKIWENYKQ